MTTPPRLAVRIVGWAAARLSWGETACGDLAEEHALLTARRGRTWSAAWYWGQAALLVATVVGQFVIHESRRPPASFCSSEIVP